MAGWWFGTCFSIYWEFHHPNWQTHIFQRGRSTTNQMVFEVCLPPPSSSCWWWWWLYCPDIPIQQNLSIHEICLSLVHFRPLQPPKPTWMYYSKGRSLAAQTPNSKNMVLSENWVSPKAFCFVGLFPRNFGVKLHFFVACFDQQQDLTSIAGSAGYRGDSCADPVPAKEERWRTPETWM